MMTRPIFYAPTVLSFSNLTHCLRPIKAALTLLAALLLAVSTPAQAERLLMVEKWYANENDPKLKQYAGDILDIHKKLTEASGVKATLYLSPSDDVNAYASQDSQEKFIAINYGLLKAFQDDRDAVAFVMAHEFAHIGKDHIDAGKTSSTIFGVLGAVIGGVINYKLGTSQLGHDIASVGAKAATRTFSRAQERDADAVGLSWLIAAGYNPQGAVRVQEKFIALAGKDSGWSLFRTHPVSEERLETIKKAIDDSEAARQLSSPTKVALTIPAGLIDDAEDDDEEGAR